MDYKLGGIIISKKPHACGNNEWEIVRLGADVKLKCKECKRTVFLSFDEAKRIAKTYIEPMVDNG
jgi:hypothetical protein